MSLVHTWHQERKERMARLNPSAPPQPMRMEPRIENTEVAGLRRMIEDLGSQVVSLVQQVNAHAVVISNYIAKETDETPKFGDIIDSTCEFYQVSRTDVMGSRRTLGLVIPRQMICYLARHLTGLSFPQMGRRLGGRDHTTAMHNANKMGLMLATDEKLKSDCKLITTAIGARVMKRRELSAQ